MSTASRVFLSIVAVALLLIGTNEMRGQASKRIPAKSMFRDAADNSTVPPAPLDRIRSDGLGWYTDGVNCVINYFDRSSGFYFLRTVKSACTDIVQRAITLDFSDAIIRTPDGSGADACHVNDGFNQSGDLNICGSNALPDVRIIANTLFRDNALTGGTAVTLPISLQPDFSGTGFELDFEQPAGVTGDATTRFLTAGPDAVAELYKNVRKGPRISLGRFRMPFQLTVTLK